MKKKIVIVLSLVFLLHFRLHAQTTTTIDFYPQKENVKASLPYDQPFQLRVHYSKPASVNHAYLYKHKGKRSFAASLKKEKAGTDGWTFISFSPVASLTDSVITFLFKRDSTTSKNFIRRIFRPFNSGSSLLKPGCNYSLVRDTTNVYNDITKALQNMYDVNAHWSADDRKLMAALKAANEKQTAMNIIHIQPGSERQYLSDYEAFALKRDTAYKKRIYKILNFHPDKKYPDGEVDSCSCHQVPLDTIYKYFDESSQKARLLNCSNNCLLDSIIKELDNIDSCRWSILYTGQKSLKDLLTVKASSFSFDQDTLITEKTNGQLTARISNIDVTTRLLNQFIIALENVSLSYSSHLEMERIHNVTKCYREKIMLLQEVKRIFNEAKDTVQKRYEDISQLDFGNTSDVVNLNSYILSFQTRNDLMITPVFGYAYYGFQHNFQSFTPYLGFQINFQAMNKDVPFRLTPDKTLMQRLCFITGWTLTKIAEDQKRFDLFAGGSLLTGIGLKLSHAVTLSGGALIFKKADTNPLLSTHPVTCTPYVSLSVNSDISKLFGDFTKLIPTK